MISKTAVARETARRLRAQSAKTADDVRRLRLDAGVSLRELGAVANIHPSHLARIEAAQVKPSMEVLTKIGVALGADLSLRYFAGTGPRLHDRFQAPMVEGLLRILDPRWGPTPEVSVTHPARGVIDVVLDDRSSPATIATESQSEFRRLEEQVRRSTEKADGLADRLAREGRAGRTVSRLLLIRSTEAKGRSRGGSRHPYERHIRRGQATFPSLDRTDYPVARLRDLVGPTRSGVATILATPPRGVSAWPLKTPDRVGDDAAGSSGRSAGRFEALASRGRRRRGVERPLAGRFEALRRVGHDAAGSSGARRVFEALPSRGTRRRGVERPSSGASRPCRRVGDDAAAGD